MKRAKKVSGFRSVQDAGEYVDALLELNPKLTVTLWSYIFAMNNELSVLDINLMYRARPEAFGEFYEKGEIFMFTFKRQFGSGDFNIASNWTDGFIYRRSNVGQHLLQLLVAWRLFKRLEKFPHAIELGEKAKIRLSIERETTRGAILSSTDNPDGTVTVQRGPPKYITRVKLEGEELYPGNELVQRISTILNTQPDSDVSSYVPSGKRKERIVSAFDWELVNDPDIYRKTFLVLYVAMAKNLTTPSRSEYVSSQICTVCKSAARFKCGNECGRVLYCSEACAQSDWSQSHQFQCI